MRIAKQHDLKEAAERGLRNLYPARKKIAVGAATCGLASGAEAVIQALSEEIERRRLDIDVIRTGCIGFCQQEPLVDIFVPGKPKITYGKITPKKARELISDLAQGNGLQKKWALYRTEEEEHIITGERRQYPLEQGSKGLGQIPSFQEHPFFKKQKRIILRNCGIINPENIEEYIARGGYQALWNTLSDMTPEEVIREVKEAGLRGRGGAGFPTGRKWELCCQAPGGVKYVVCNADEGDPGAFMDRSVLEGDPHSVLEGLTIGAYAIGAHDGFIYVRAEYPLAIKSLRAAIKQAEECALLGKDIFGSGFDFKVHLVEGAGAFVCGEETGLMASIEGRVGEPHQRPPFPAQKGLWGCPTNINNVKTCASVAPIIARGAAWYASMGTEENRGTTVFSLVGKVKNNGLIEVPLGISLEEVVFDIGGGVQDDKSFKAVQTGGPSGGCIPASLLNLPVDYECLTEAGSMMGSGGMVVMDEDTCVVDVAKYFLQFTTDESCGKCTPCREGTRWMLQILTRITEGHGETGDIEQLETLGRIVKDTSLCGLGSTAPNPVLSTIRYFRDEYEAHIRDSRCPAAICRRLVVFRIIPEQCNGCHVCVKVCPVEAITGTLKEPHVIDEEKCTQCRACYEACRFDAIVGDSVKTAQVQQ
jgi:NADH:ubiquinone oxidoreductase subunit F (NADH-binding)/(2Fe-2S) ferredoxin